MKPRERWILTAFLSAILVLVGSDLWSDRGQGAEFWHLLLEGGTGILAGLAILYLVHDAFRLRQELKNQTDISEKSLQAAEAYKKEAKRYIEGLSAAIDSQLQTWELTSAEKEVAFLLLKGLSIKEIGEVRNTAEKTVRSQALAIYSKSGLQGRSQLAAFFLEDLLAPQSQNSH